MYISKPYVSHFGIFCWGPIETWDITKVSGTFSQGSLNVGIFFLNFENQLTIVGLKN